MNYHFKLEYDNIINLITYYIYYFVTNNKK